MSKSLGQKLMDVPVNIVGSTKFGRYPKISNEQTFNMIISDGWLVNFAGHIQVNNFPLGNESRGIYNSTENNSIYLVIDENLYKFISPGFFQSADS